VKTSHPGYPWCKFGLDNGTVLSDYGTLLWDEVAKRFNNYLAYGETIFKMTPEELIQHGICDPVKVFIKKEPHSDRKITTGQLRIISSVSLLDQICERLTSSLQNKAEIEQWTSCPSAPGMGLNDEGLRIIFNVAKGMTVNGGTLCETDVSGWDWSMQEWELDMDADLRGALMGQEVNSLMHFFLRVQAYCTSHSAYVTPDGQIYAQTIPGGQNSGRYNTSSTNSRGRVIASLACRWLNNDDALTLREYELKYPNLGIKAMGDDSFEIYFEGLAESMSLLGHTVKMCVQRPNLEGLEFCSQVFLEAGVAYPVNFAKTLYRFLSHNPSDPKYPEYMAQLANYFRHMPKTEYNRRILHLASARVANAQRYLRKDGESEIIYQTEEKSTGKSGETPSEWDYGTATEMAYLRDETKDTKGPNGLQYLNVDLSQTVPRATGSL